MRRRLEKNNLGFSTCFFGQFKLHFVQDFIYYRRGVGNQRLRSRMRLFFSYTAAQSGLGKIILLKKYIDVYFICVRYFFSVLQ